MGEWVDLGAFRRAKQARTGPVRVRESVELFIDLADPLSYLAAERAERILGRVTWVPAAHVGLRADLHSGAVHARVRARAVELRLPIVWPDDRPAEVRRAMRVLAVAQEHGRGAEFALAASRLAFCGGYSLVDPAVLDEAIAAAGLDLKLGRASAADAGWDASIDAAGRWLREAGMDSLPVVRVGRALFPGEARMEEALGASRWARTADLP